MSWGSDLNLDEVLGVQVVLDGNVLSSEELLLDSLKLTLIHILGEVLLDHWDSSGLGGSDESSNSDVLHIKIIINYSK